MCEELPKPSARAALESRSDTALAWNRQDFRCPAGQGDGECLSWQTVLNQIKRLGAADGIVNVPPGEGRDPQPDLPHIDGYTAENDKAIARYGAVEEWSKKLPGGH